MEDKVKRILTLAFFSFLLGIPGFGMALGDIGNGRTIIDWILLGAGYFFFAGFLLGLVDPYDWYLAGLAAWGPLIISAAILILNIQRQPFNPMSLLLPIALSLVGSLIGSVARAKIGAR